MYAGLSAGQPVWAPGRRGAEIGGLREMAGMSERRRTSETDPLQVGVAPGPWPGRLGLTLLPGRNGQAPTTGGFWARDVAVDLGVLKAGGWQEVLCLATHGELLKWGVDGYAGAVAAAGLGFHHRPLPDGYVPQAWEDVRGIVEDLHGRLVAGRAVVVHCVAGLGRTGLIAGLALRLGGVSADETLARLHAARGPHCPEPPQTAYLRAWSAPDPS